MRSIPGGLHHGGIRCHTKDVPNVFAYSFSCFEVVKLNLHRDVATNDVQPSGEPQNRRQLCDAVTGEL
jgi:hypothetical protein